MLNNPLGATTSGFGLEAPHPDFGGAPGSPHVRGSTPSIGLDGFSDKLFGVDGGLTP